MRMLMTAVVVMGVLIVAGVATVAVTIVTRLGAAPSAAASFVLDEPAGTRIAGVAALPDRLAVTLQGGGPDRVVVLDLRTGRVVAHAALAR